MKLYARFSIAALKLNLACSVVRPRIKLRHASSTAAHRALPHRAPPRIGLCPIGLRHAQINLMECPNCGVLRYRAEWRPSQWKSCDPITAEYRNCKVCQFVPPPPPRDVPPPPPPPPLFRAGGENDGVEHGTSAAAQRIVLLASTCHPSSLHELIAMWMNDLPKKTRKVLSYSGALRCRDPRCPVHYVSTGGVRFFDPGNYVYALTFDMLWPLHASENRWNIETKGDILEALMGFAFEKSNAEDLSSARWLEHANILAAYIEEMSYQVWLLSVAHGSSDILCWLDRLREKIQMLPGVGSAPGSAPPGVGSAPGSAPGSVPADIPPRRGRWRKRESAADGAADGGNFRSLADAYDKVLLDTHLCKEVPKHKPSLWNIIVGD